MRRFMGLALLTAAGLMSAAASCQPTAPVPDPVITSASLAVSEAVQTVRSAAAMRATTSLHVVLTADRTVAMEGNLDLAAGMAEVTARGAGPSSRRVGGDVYVKPADNAGWIHLELARMQAGSINLALLRLATQTLI